MRILVVDDETTIRDLCCQTLSLAGYDVSTAESGEEAVERLGEDWDIVITDLMMPGAVDGNELVRRTRALGSADVLIMTAHPAMDTAIQAVRGGAFDYLLKPFSLDTLLTAVQRCVEKRQLSRELAREKALRAELDQAYTSLARMEKVRETFGQFVTPEVAEYVLAHPDDFWKRGERKVVTILFADVRAFSSFSARIQPEEAVSALNDIFVRVIDAIHREGGVLNKFLGDGLMALFGAPVPNEDHVFAAARAALRAQSAVEAWAGSRPASALGPLRIGIGINTGAVMAGCVGTRERAEYSVIGHPVNLAARLEEQAAPGQILVGPETARLLAGAFELRDLAPMRLTGIPDPVPMVELLGQKGDPVPRPFISPSGVRSGA